MSKIIQFAKAIVEYEDMDPRCNNPGALRYSKFEVGKKCYPHVGCFSYFNTREDGMNALIFQLQIACDGRSRAYDPTDTLYDFFSKYAPTYDKNNPNLYAETVAKKMGISPKTQLKDLL